MKRILLHPAGKCKRICHILQKERELFHSHACLQFGRPASEFVIFSFPAGEKQTLALCAFTATPPFLAKLSGEKPPRLPARGLSRVSRFSRVFRRGAPAGEGGKGMAGGTRRVCGTSPSGWASAGNIKAAPSPKNSAPPKSMRTHGPSFPFPQPCYPPLQKRGGMGIISPWRSSNCCAEWYGHSYRAVGCLLHPAACRIHVSSCYCYTDLV